MSSFTDSLAQAIARMEGFFSPGSLAARNHNPGNLRAGVGQIGTSGGFAVFASDADGFAALDHQIDLNVSRGLTLQEFFGGKPGVYGGYAPGADANDPAGYAANVSQWTGIPLGVPLSDLGAAGAELGVPADSGPITDSWGPFGSTDGSAGLSTAAMVGLAAAAGLLAWAVFSR